jgi:predicted nucleotidyltransferase
MQKLEDIARRYKLELILIFGSYASGESHSGSDIDIAVYGQKILSEKVKIGLISEFSGIFHKEKIDLVDIKTASPLLKKEIFKNYKVLYQKSPMLLYQLELVSIYEYKESEILFQIRHERLKEFIE